MAEEKRFTRKEVAERNSESKAMFIIENHVYDVTKFLDDHPGGHEVLLNVAGKDASEDFDDVGHSLDARELMKNYLVGELVPEDWVEMKARQMLWEATAEEDWSTGFLYSWKLPVLLGVIASVMYVYLFG